MFPVVEPMWAGLAGQGLASLHMTWQEKCLREESLLPREMGSAIRSYLLPARGNCSAARPGLTDCGPASPVWLTQAESSWEAKPDKGACGHFCPLATEARGAGGSEARCVGLAAGVDTCPPPNTCSSSKVSLQAAVTFLLKSLVTGELRCILGVSRMPALYCVCLAETAASSIDKIQGPSFRVHPSMFSRNPDKQRCQFLPLLNSLV